MRNFDQLEIGFMHRILEAFITVPIGVGLFYYNAALEQELLKYAIDVEFFVLRVAYAECDVLEVTKHRHADVFLVCSHNNWSRFKSYSMSSNRVSSNISLQCECAIDSGSMVFIHSQNLSCSRPPAGRKQSRLVYGLPPLFNWRRQTADRAVKDVRESTT